MAILAPAVLKLTLGFCRVEVAGVPPGKDQEYPVALFVELPPNSKVVSGHNTFVLMLAVAFGSRVEGESLKDLL